MRAGVATIRDRAPVGAIGERALRAFDALFEARDGGAIRRRPPKGRAR